MPKQKRSGRALLITFEGIDGSGKSTQIALAHQYLSGKGYQVVMLREPGSTRVAEKIRDLLLDKTNRIENITELLLYEAARSEITAKEILPNLIQGVIVLCDRFYDSTTAYQGNGRGLDIGLLTRLHRVAVGDLKPDLTLLFDLPVKTGISRRNVRLKRSDRLESQSKAFFNRVRRGFLEIARKEPRRVKLVDARRSPEDIFKEVARYMDGILNRKLARLKL